MQTATGTNGAPTDASEPGQTETNSATVLAEDALTGDGDAASPVADETSTRPKIGAIPSSYGAPGGSTPPEADA